MWPPEQLISIEEFLLREPEGEYRSEYRQGRVTAMAGASEAHELIVWNLGTLLGIAFANRPCRAFLGNMRVQVAEAQFITYPDVVAVCDTPKYRDEKRTTLLNPTALFEVLSPSTEAYDRNEKFQSYQRIASLREYVLVYQDRLRIEAFQRANGTWQALDVLEGGQATLELPSLGCRFNLSDIYRKVVF